ncbi:MAG: cytochrome bc complex cytochrome b subunit, partial [Gemmatimonadetes bacterium]|nr:cytochrome bc complex cytochrome b subunit [Gemmatimonadota bacterium]
LHFHPVFAVVILPLAGAVGLVMIAYLGYDEDSSGIWFVSYRGRALAKAAAAAGLVVTPLMVMAEEWLVDLAGVAPGVTPFVRDGVLPVGVCGLALWGGYRWLRTRKSATRAEAVQTAFVFFAVAFLVLTVVGVWFRGPGMSLGWAGW